MVQVDTNVDTQEQELSFRMPIKVSSQRLKRVANKCTDLPVRMSEHFFLWSRSGVLHRRFGSIPTATC